MRKLLHDYRFLLALIIIGAVVLRSIPAWVNPIWGCNYGIFYGIVLQLAENPKLYQPDLGWGESYEYFPVLYLITLSFSLLAHHLTGISIDSCIRFFLPKIAPVFGGLTVLILYFIALELFKSKKLALLSSALLAVSTIQLYQTSEAAPLTMGHFFLLLSIYFFIKYRKNPAWTGPLYVSTIFLILSHHLSTYFYLISICAIVVLKNWDVPEWDKNIKADLFYILAASAFAFGYWAFIATPVFGFMGGATALKPISIMGLFYLVLISSLLACHIRMKRYKRRVQHPPAGFNWMRFLASMTIIAVLTISIKVFNVLGGERIHWILLLYLTLVFSISISLAIFGWSYLRLYKNGRIIMAWIGVILLSLLYGVITGNRYLYPERHIEYLAGPLCIAAAIGFIAFTARLQHDYRKVAVLCLGGILIAQGAAYYPLMISYWPYPSATHTSTVNMIEWMERNLPNNATIASDFRIGAQIEANHTKGFRSTFAFGNSTHIWNATDLKDCLPSLEYIDPRDNVTRRVGYIAVDDIMYRYGVNINMYEISGYLIQINNTSYPIFQSIPFRLMYRNCTYTGYNETALQEIWSKKIRNETVEIDYMELDNEEFMEYVSSWAEIYKVDWEWIEKNEKEGAG